ncbi:class I SAM-dependent methyltransferase [Actinomycetospora sp. OC33-EN08]|uniref:Class I SAM-dependent methyltransferase n=1 Tax=Actinomycetospora aurantiaca TaxID=3129233 RepID=A0ABU8MXF2_9PSEU
MTTHGHGHGAVLDLDADVLGDQLVSIVDGLPLPEAPRHVVDLGAGTGAGTFVLLDRFPGAHVTAVDASTEHLARLREKAGQAGVGGRVDTVQADLDATWPDLGTPDLVWASGSLHHLADPVLALREVRRILAPGGLLAVLELSGPPRFLPADSAAGALEDRCHVVADRRANAHMPHRGADWGPLLSAAGLTVEDRRDLSVDATGPHPEAVGRYALMVLQRLRHAVADELSAEDVAALDALVDVDGPGSLLRRDDLVVRTERTVWVAR